jgi:NAD(P)-dependent dehydrogenase (short-subunit alcohol dehydrogenase family)
MMNESSQAAIVTGAGRGIGRSIAIALAAHGCRVMLAARSIDELQSVCDEIRAAGGLADYVRCDAASENDINHLIDATLEKFGQIDIVVNNAGTGHYGLLEKSTTEDWDTMMNVNARGTYLVCREAIPHLRQSKNAFIINIGSVVSHKGYTEQAIYAASKHAMLGMTKALARELQSDGIRVHAVCPGGVETDLVTRSRPDLDRSVLMQPDDIADIVLFLITRRGNAVIDEINVRRMASTPWA